MDTAQAPSKPLCSHCGNYSSTSDYCSNCSRPIKAQHGVAATAPRSPAPTNLPGEELAGVLTILGMVILVTGSFFGLYVWGEYGTISSGGFFGQEVSVSNPYARIVAFAIIANSVIWCALLCGVGRAIRNTVVLSTQIAQLRAKQS